MENICSPTVDVATVAPVTDDHTPPLPAVLSLQAAARYLDVKEATLRDWRVDRKGPPAIKYGRLVKYRQADLDAWLTERQETR